MGVDISEKVVNICNSGFSDEDSCRFEVGILPYLAVKTKYDIVLYGCHGIF